MKTHVVRWTPLGVTWIAACASTVGGTAQDGGTTQDGGVPRDTEERTIVGVRTGLSGPTAAGSGFNVVAIVQGRAETVGCRTNDEGRCELPVAPASVQAITIERGGYESVSVVAPPTGEIQVVTRPLQSGALSPQATLQFDPSTERASLLTASGGFFELPAYQGTSLWGLTEAAPIDFVASTISPTGEVSLSTARSVVVPPSFGVLRLPAPRVLAVRPVALVLELPGAVTVAPTGVPRTRVELDQPAGVGSFAKAAFYDPPTSCVVGSGGGSSLRCSFGLVDHPDFRAPWIHFEAPASGAGAASVTVDALLGGAEPRVEISRPGEPVVIGRSVGALRVDATAVAGRALSVVVEPTASSTTGVDVWVVHYPANRGTQALVLPPIPVAFAARVRATAARTVDVRVHTWSANVVFPWAVESYTMSPRSSVVSAPVTLDL